MASEVTDLATVTQERVAVMPAIPDAEIESTWRIAKALAASGMFKDVRQAEQAFAKILIGRDLGISPTQAMMSIDLVKGSVQLRGVLLASFIRKHPDYDYRVKVTTEEQCEVEFLRRFDGVWEPIGEAGFTIDRARKAGLVKDGGAWKAHPQNMLLWRALSNGVKFYMPDLMGGIPVYTEADDFREAKHLGAGDGDGQPEGIELPAAVEDVLARAADLGHAGLADRGAAEIAVGGQPEEVVAAWVERADAELHDIADAELADGEPVEPGEVVA